MREREHDCGDRRPDRPGGVLRLLVARRLTRYPARYMEIFRIPASTGCIVWSCNSDSRIWTAPNARGRRRNGREPAG
jgi:hypothetical protein